MYRNMPAPLCNFTASILQRWHLETKTPSSVQKGLRFIPKQKCLHTWIHQASYCMWLYQLKKNYFNLSIRNGISICRLSWIFVKMCPEQLPAKQARKCQTEPGVDEISIQYVHCTIVHRKTHKNKICFSSLKKTFK